MACAIFRHSFHEIELLDILNILFPSQRGKLYQVIGIGIQEEFRNPYVIIKGGARLFPCPCEFSYFQGRCFAYSC
ncbi:hypothetical protein B4083_2239 [Bacillus cereus]|nr:hypothetical protein B4083_2239 [Bacillus cereus]